MSQLKFIDISSWQHKTPIDWPTLKTQIDGVIIKATESTDYTNPYFAEDRAGSTAVGLLRAYYHFARPEDGHLPEEEANYFIRTVGNLASGECVALDWESTWGGNADDYAYRFLQVIEQHYGIKAFVYINKSTQKGKNWTKVVEGNYPLWLADYENTGTAAPWKFIALQQMTSSAKYNGISGNIDADLFYGTVDAWYAYGYKTPATPQPDPTPQPEPQPEPIDPDKQIIAEFKVTVDNLVALNKGLNEELVTVKNDNTALQNTINNQSEQLKALQAQLDTASKEPWWKKYVQRKFLLGAAGFIIPILNSKFGWNIDPVAIVTSILSAAAFIAGETVLDNQKIKQG